ncbi:hypothetical protein LTS17_009958 [Exophiala oligosperma]
MAENRVITLNTGAKLPVIGLGTWQSTDAVATEGRKSNEAPIGKAIRGSGIPRSDIFVTDKVWPTWLSRAEESLDNSLRALGLDYIDLWLMHWPVALNPNGNDKKFPRRPDGSPDYEEGWGFLDAWRSMEAIFQRHPDKVKAIGVSNCSTTNLEKILRIATIVPAANQVELHPSLPQDKLVSYCKSKQIALIAYSPLGSPSSQLIKETSLEKIAAKHGRNVAQCLISWGIQSGWAVVPKSVSLDTWRDPTEEYSR